MLRTNQRDANGCYICPSISCVGSCDVNASVPLVRGCNKCGCAFAPGVDSGSIACSAALCVGCVPVQFDCVRCTCVNGARSCVHTCANSTRPQMNVVRIDNWTAPIPLLQDMVSLFGVLHPSLSLVLLGVELEQMASFFSLSSTSTVARQSASLMDELRLFFVEQGMTGLVFSQVRSTQEVSVTVSSLSGAEIAGIVLGSVAFAALVSIGLVFVIRRYRVKTQDTATENNAENTSADI